MRAADRSRFTADKAFFVKYLWIWIADFGTARQGISRAPNSLPDAVAGNWQGNARGSPRKPWNARYASILVSRWRGKPPHPNEWPPGEALDLVTRRKAGARAHVVVNAPTNQAEADGVAHRAWDRAGQGARRPCRCRKEGPSRPDRGREVIAGRAERAPMPSTNYLSS